MTKKLANAVGGKTARACDNCIKKRARWYCPADDAFLCQSCDGSVHSANPLASRHERVRLKISSSIAPSKEMTLENIAVPPSWHRGFTKKARTPRQGGKHAKSKFGKPPTTTTTTNPLLHHHHHLVPEVCSDENSHEDNDEQLVYRVPIFDPFVAELCTTANSHGHDDDDGAETCCSTDIAVQQDESNINKAVMAYDDCINDLNHDQLHGGSSLPSELELAEFAADVESLLGKGLEAESFDMEGLGLSDCKEKDLLLDISSGTGKVKVEEDEGEVGLAAMGVGHHDQVGTEIIDLARETFELNFDYYDSPLTCEEDNKARVDRRETVPKEDHDAVIPTKKILLRLNYDGVIAAWDGQRSPWTNGERPELDSKDSWPDCMGFCGTVVPYGEGMMFGHAAMVDGGREARVSRYREKRRTRLFSKKIRYEVRKLNAEKRPRMKGRFVKRANLSGNIAFPLHSK